MPPCTVRRRNCRPSPLHRLIGTARLARELTAGRLSRVLGCAVVVAVRSFSMRLILGAVGSLN